MNDKPVLIKFFDGWVEDGIGKDGLPMFRNQLMIMKYVHPNTRLEVVATEDDIENYPQPYALYVKETAARKATEAEGYPLVMWPAVREAELKMLAARDVHTVEQLAKLGGRQAGQNMPAELKDLADRAVKLIGMQQSVGKFEKIIADKDGQIAALQEQ